MLEITDLDGPPVYAGINDSSATTLTITTRQQFAFWRRPGSVAGVPSALKLVCQRNGDSISVDASVTAGRGGGRRRPQSQDSGPSEHLGTYSTALGKSIAFQDLNRFGFEPVFIKVVTAKNHDEVPLKVENKTNAIKALSVSEINGSCLLTIKNVSSKKIIALTVRMPLDGGRSNLQVDGSVPIAVSLLGNESSPATRIKSQSYTAIEWRHGQGVFAPGQEYRLMLPVTRTGNITAQGYAPDENPSRIIVTGLVFDDSTFEGDADTALRLTAERTGTTIQINHVLTMLQAALDDHHREDFEVLDNLWLKGSELKEDPDKKTLGQITKGFPPLSKMQKVELKFWIYSAMEGVKRSILIDIRRYQTQQGRPNPDFRSWLSSLKTRYEATLHSM